MTIELPTVVTSAGLQPQKPVAVLAQLIESISAIVPGYTANLPASLIEDMSSTAVAAILQADSARVDLVNSLTPYGVNAFLLNQLGQQFGIPRGQASNTSVFVIFTGTPGFVIAKGFTISDGTYQYVIQDGGIVGADRGDGLGVSPQLFAVATNTGTWAVAAGTVQGLITSVPNTITLTVNNPQVGIPSEAQQTEEEYRAQVLAAGLAAAQGMPTLLKTLLGTVDGVQARLVSVLQKPNNGGWEIIVGGGDPYQVGYQIFRALGAGIGTLVGSEMTVASISKAADGVVTTSMNHGYVNGNVVEINGATGMTQINGVPLTVTVINEKSFSTGVNTTAFGTYISGGILTPNNRNIIVSINDYPDAYMIPYVTPPQQSVTVILTWNTNSPNFVSGAAVAQIGAPAVSDYINSIPVGQPINEFELQSVFIEAIKDILPSQLLTRIIIAVSINGIGTTPVPGTGIIQGDPESYFLSTAADIVISQG